MKIKTYPADKAFALCVKERVNWICERCGKYYPEGHRGGLECSHLFSRRHFSTRFHPDNAFAHCTGCHSYLGGNPVLFHRWAELCLGSGLINILSEKHNDTTLGKMIKKNLKEVKKHYTQEFEKLRTIRAEGSVGRLEFVSYA